MRIPLHKIIEESVFLALLAAYAHIKCRKIKSQKFLNQKSEVITPYYLHREIN